MKNFRQICFAILIIVSIFDGTNDKVKASSPERIERFLWSNSK